jgi:tRNA (mo5U34)-methyltransferase
VLELEDLREEVAKTTWYHTIELPGGVRTPGLYDTVDTLRHVPLPQSLAGKRCLDVATNNGFWAFEMERRGADEVVAMDVGGQWEKIDWPAGVGEAFRGRDIDASGSGFEIAHDALDSKVQYKALSVYELSPEEVGEFDFVFLGALLLHLRDPVKALTAIRSVTGGTLFVNEAVSIPLSMLRPRTPTVRLIGMGGPNWWVPNLAALKRMLMAAGFEVQKVGRPYGQKWGEGAESAATQTPDRIKVRGLTRKLGRRFIGIPHIWLTAVPRSTDGGPAA